MHVRFSEDYREWRRFTLQTCAIILAIVAFLSWRGTMNPRTVGMVAAVPGVAALAVLVRPRWFRGFYRRGKIFDTWMGKWGGGVTLTVFYFVVMVPLGCVLRWVGYDPLGLKKTPGASTYWRRAPKAGAFDKMF